MTPEGGIPPTQHRALLPAGLWMNFMECGSLDHLVSPSMCEPLRKEMACFVLKLKLTMWPRMTLTSNQSSYLCSSVLGLQTCATRPALWFWALAPGLRAR